MEKKDTSLGYQRFRFFLQQLQTILSAIKKEENPALSFYRQNARTPLFMLEALSRIYRNLHNQKKFIKLQERFKALEDMLGAVDYYDSFYKEFSDRANIPAGITDYFLQKRDGHLLLLNETLEEDGWLSPDDKRLNKIYKRLGKMDWMEEAAETKAIAFFYRKTIQRINEDISSHEINFDDVETDVHELRRELRWLSIYPQALRGLMELKPTAASPDHLYKYLTAEIINSPFNQLPEGAGLDQHIYLNQNYFYALSWMIAELGKLKDSGLRLHALAEALVQVNNLKRQEAEEVALGICGQGQLTTAEILSKAKQISETFFAEKNLDWLVL